ncbi:MAG TPA: PIG-L family deacetylase [Pirellulales bacterium]|jgi:LmbE family N-acetylglucosaminyl deacetylase|nr:PIG-L family deacetylase [Pirellulales bacterium]
MKPRAFAIFAHPDDIEFVAAGTLLRLRNVGYEIHYMNVADGCCGSTEYGREELIGMRRDEAMAACRLVGAKFHESIAHDMDVFYDRPTLARLAAVVRQVAPEIVLTHAPADYMEDHMNTCRLAVTAAFARGMPNFLTDPPTPAIATPITVYHAQPHGNCDPLYVPVRPTLCVDIGDVLDEKTTMLACHASQKRWLDESQGFDSYLHTMRQGSHTVGQLSGRFEYAEGWRRHLHLGFCAEDADPLAKALAKSCVKLS